MWFLFLLTASGAIAGAVQAADGQGKSEQTTSSASYTNDKHFVLTKRAGSTATVTLGPTSNYKVTLTSTPSVPPTPGFTIIPAGDDASDGVNVVLAPSVQTALSKAYQDKCSNQHPTDQQVNDCASAVRAFFPPDQVSIQKRVLGLVALVGAGIAALIAGVAMLAGSAPTYHIPGNDISQLNNPDPPGAIAIAGGASPINLPVQPDDVSETDPSIEAAGSDGSILIKAPKDLVQRTNGLFASRENGGRNCPGPSTKRDLDKRQGLPDFTVLSTCIAALAVAFIINVNQGPLANWVRLRRPQAQVAPEGAGALLVVENIRQQVQPQQRQLGLDNVRWNDIINLAYQEAYNRIVNRVASDAVTRISGNDIKKKYCPSTDFLKCSNVGCNGKKGVCAADSALTGCKCDDKAESNDCDPDEPLPCVNCGGDAGGGICNGISNKQNAYKECKCTVFEPYYPSLFANARELASVQDAILKLPTFKKKAEPVPPPSCKNSDKALTYDTSMFQELATNGACSTIFKKHPLSESFDTKINHDKNPDWQIRFIWQPKQGDCTQDCNTIFSTFLKSKQCTPDDRVKAPSGEIDLDCGTAKYEFVRTPGHCPVGYPNTWGLPMNTKNIFMRQWWFDNGCALTCPDGAFDPGNGGLGSCKNDPCAGVQCANQDQASPW